MSTRRPIILAAVVSAAIATVTPASAADEIGVFFDPEATTATWTTSAPDELVTAYLVLLEPSATEPIGAWECRLAWQTPGPDVVVVQWNLRGDGTNFGTAPDFIVGVGSPLPPAAQVVLMDFLVLVPSPADPVTFFVQPFSVPSLTLPPGSPYTVQLPLYSSGASGDLTVLTQTSGCESLPVAEINGPAPAPVVDLDAPPLVVLPFEHVNYTEFPVTNTGSSPLAALVDVSAPAGVLLAIDGRGWVTGPLWLHLEAGEQALVGVKALDDAALPVSCTFSACGSVLHETIVRDDVPAMAVTPTEIDFGVTQVGVPVTRQATLTNRTRHPMNITVVRPSPSAFLVADIPPIAPFGSTTFDVVFFPWLEGYQTCDISLVWTLNEEHAVTLSCEGFAEFLHVRTFDFEDVTAGTVLGEQYWTQGVGFAPTGRLAGLVVAEQDGYQPFDNSPVNAVHVGEIGESLTIVFGFPDAPSAADVHRLAFRLGDGDPEFEMVDIIVSGPDGAVLYEQTVGTMAGGYLFSYLSLEDEIASVTLALASNSESTAFLDDLTIDDLGDVTTPAPGGVVSGRPQLLGNRPNPFNPQTVITFALPAATDVALRVYDLRGRLVRVLVDGPCAAGYHDVTWDGRDDTGGEVASGVYVYRLETRGACDSRRLVVVR